MIRIEVNENKISILGHGTNEACARVSTTIQIYMELSKKTDGILKPLKLGTGISVFEIKENKCELDRIIYESFISYLIELSLLYPSHIKIKLEGE